MKNRKNQHHLLARSRGGKRRKNIVQLPIYFHEAWHRVFDTLTVEEVHQFIDLVMVAGCKWSKGDIEQLRKRVREP